MKLVKRETIFSKARCSFILCRDGAAYKISAPEMIQHKGYTVVYMLKVISILWDSSKRNCISPFYKGKMKLGKVFQSSSVTEIHSGYLK